MVQKRKFVFLKKLIKKFHGISIQIREGKKIYIFFLRKVGRNCLMSLYSLVRCTDWTVKGTMVGSACWWQYAKCLTNTARRKRSNWKREISLYHMTPISSGLQISYLIFNYLVQAWFTWHFSSLFLSFYNFQTTGGFKCNCIWSIKLPTGFLYIMWGI